MKKILTVLLLAGLALGLWGMNEINANNCKSSTAEKLGYTYEVMAYYLDINQEPLTFDYHKGRWELLKEEYNKAVKEGLPDTCELIVSDGKKQDGVKVITFGALKELYPKWAAIMEAPDGEAKIEALKKSKDHAADEKSFGEYYRTLKGDKLAEFKTCKNCIWYTTGKRQMTTARELQNASLWCTASSNSEGFGRWKVDCMRFSGNKKVNQYQRSGSGSTSAPASVFK